MGYATFKSESKAVTTSDQIGAGQVKLEHLDPALFSELRNVNLHSHTGTGSRKIQAQDLTGYFPMSGFYMYGTNGTKYLVRIIGGAWDISAA